jgi:hypothetical protein
LPVLPATSAGVGKPYLKLVVGCMALHCMYLQVM